MREKKRPIGNKFRYCLFTFGSFAFIRKGTVFAYFSQKAWAPSSLACVALQGINPILPFPNNS